MSQNRNQVWKYYRKRQILKRSQNRSAQRGPNIKSHDFCQKCGRSLKFYTYQTNQLCQICSRDEENYQNDVLPPVSNTQEWQSSQPRSDPTYNSYDGLNMSNFEKNYNNYNQETHVMHPNTWQRRIYFSESKKPPDSLNSYENFQDSQHQTQSQGATSSRLLTVTPQTTNWTTNLAPINTLYQAESNYHLSNIPSTSFQIPPKIDYKRKRELENESSKRIKASPYGQTQLQSSLLQPSQFHQYEQLSMNIMSYFRDNVQTNWVFDKKMDLRSRLQQIIERKFAGCNVFVFGSSMTGFATKTSDADMSLIFHDAKIVQNRVVRLLWELHSLFSRLPNFKKLQVIRAKVSILKFRDTLSGFEIDLNINNPTGIRNSQLLRSYARLDDRVRPLILAVKFWAREHDINDAKNGTLSSYCLGLMLIHYLQYGCSPPVLPCLQILQPDKYLPNSDISSLKLDETLPNFKSVNNQNVGQLFVGFLHYYSRLYNYKEKRISVRLGCLLPRVDKILTKENNLRHWIDIEEPFEQVNTARAVNNPRIAALIKSAFDASYRAVVQRGALGFI